MPKLDEKDRKTKPPKDVPKPKRNKRWVHVDVVGEWEPVLAEETSVLTAKERKAGDKKITREDREVARELERELKREATKAERKDRKEQMRAEKQAARQAEREEERAQQRQERKQGSDSMSEVQATPKRG